MENSDAETTGVVLEIQRMSTEDGPGLRTTVFLKGCSLRCEWCHNPESIAFAPEIQWIGARCIGCGICRESCPSGALSLGGAEIRIARQLCRGCGVCVRQCPTGAMEILGVSRKAGELASELEKDAAYYKTSGGGVTLSGGEAAMQPAFTAALLSILRKRRIHTALDTCGHCPETNLRGILPYADLVLFDIKLIDPEEHRRLTGSDNARLLRNLLLIRESMDAGEGPGELWIRTPVIPGATDSAENIGGIGAFIARHLNRHVDRWELCAFNRLCGDKYLRLGLEWPYAETPLVTTAEMEALRRAAARSGVREGMAVWTGSTREE